jgi:hypothetical protein
MAGAILERELTSARTSRVQFDIASKADDAEIRRLLRENPMPGRISLSLEREPDYFADAELNSQSKQTIVARESSRIVCVGCCTMRQRFVNGEPRRVGFLGGLRLDANWAGRFDILRRGYECFRELQSDARADFYFTSIAADNYRARNFLERGIRGMPRYEFIGEFVTLLIPIRGGRENIFKKSSGLPRRELISLLNSCNQARQFAPCWEESELIALENLGLALSDFGFVNAHQKVAGCAAIWDQRRFKQTVIRGYPSGLAFVRPAFNLWARLTEQAQLPPIGGVLAKAFVSHLVCRDESSLKELITDLFAAARQRGIELLTLGFAANDPRLEIIRRNFRGREYRSRLYIVRWPGLGGAVDELDDRVLAPEVALL